MSNNLRALAPSREAAPKSASKSTPKSAPPWESSEWQEAVRQIPGLKPFFDNLESFVDLPEGVEKLREMVLELAVTGRLETQSDADTPSSDVLDALRKEKARKIKAKEIKKGKPTPAIDAEDELHELPKGWQWVRLQEFGEFCGGGTPSKRKSEFWDGEVPWVSPKDMKSPHIVDSELKITQAALDNTRIRLLPVDSILIVARSGILKRTLPVSINDIPCTVNQDLKVIIPYDTRVSEYLRLMLRGHERFILKHLIKGGVTVQSLKYAEFELQPFPLPPLAEQRRIVSKVEGLMSLCDTLESHRRARESVRERASRSVLVHLTSAPRTASTGERPKAAPKRQASGVETLKSSWQRLSDHFEILLDQPSGPAHLRQSILQLAVQGKLVPQDPTDEPAVELYEAIQRDRTKRQQDGIDKKKKPLGEIEDAEQPFDIPKSWRWSRLANLVYLLGDGLHGTPEYEKGTQFYFVNGNNLRDGEIVIKPNTKTVSAETMEKHRKRLTDNTVLVSINGTLGNVAFYQDEPIMLGKSACYFNLADDMNKHYIRLAIECPYWMEYALKNATGSTIKNLGLKAMNNWPVPLPPEAEQKRIVSKVSVLLSQLDELSARLRSRQSTTDALLTALIHSILGSQA